MKEGSKRDPLANAVAIIGMACRFPGAGDVERFWSNLREGVGSVRFFSRDELEAAGVEPALLRDPFYVPAHGALEDVESFDAGFFGLNPKVAAATDPQQRLFLECAWEALERAGYDSATFRGTIGLYAGVSINTYLLSHPEAQRQFVDEVGAQQIAIGNRTDHFTTMVAYKMNLRGPAITVQTACSTSLVAVHLACQSLLNYQCQMALAGGARVAVPQTGGYLYRPGGIQSPDGLCRAFDAEAQGTVSGSGAGVVVLKRLSDALADGDWIHAVIRGSAINNDGSAKAGYTVPSLDGQAKAIALAQAVAGVRPDEVSYVEAHGTATPLGDPIEVAALTRVFQAKSDRKGFCALGSVKSNFGHLDTAAGVAGLIKTALALEHREIPPSLHFERPNPELRLEESPFFVNARLAEWESDGRPRRAGVSSFGIGGTNAHVVLEEAPALPRSGPSRPWQLLLVSARSSSALERATDNLRRHLEQSPGIDLADAAYTLRIGRRAFAHRRIVVCRDPGNAVELMRILDPDWIHTSLKEPREQPVVFMFPGQGSQQARMGAEVYAAEPELRRQIDLCCDRLAALAGLDLKSELFAPEGESRLDQTYLTQPALFVLEYALARLFMSWGISPRAMIGHSLGEYVAACLAGVFSLDDALRLVAERGRLVQSLPPGAMLSVQLPEAELRERLGPDLALAAVNRPSLCVVSGPAGAVERLERELAAEEVACRRLRTSHAFHSAMMDPILEPFAQVVHTVELRPPSLPFVSNLTGRWIEPEQAVRPEYWVEHLRSTVRFGDGVETLLREGDGTFLEVGPRMVLTSLVRQHPAKAAGHLVLGSLHQGRYEVPEAASLMITLGRLWLAGIEPDWASFHAGERRRRLPLPTYPFERRRYWLDGRSAATLANPLDGEWKPDMADWFWTPSWQRSPAAAASQPGGPAQRWLVFVDGAGLGDRVLARLRELGHDTVRVAAGAELSRLGDGSYALAPGRAADYRALLGELRERGWAPQRVLHLWSAEPFSQGDAFSPRDLVERGFYSLLYLAQALGQGDLEPLQIDAVSSGMQEVMKGELRWPEKAALLGPCKVIPKEYGTIRCRSIDLLHPGDAEPLLAELLGGHDEPTVALRGGYRWVQSFAPLRLPPVRPEEGLRPGGVYLITGGFGGMGRSLAEHLAKTVSARLVLTGRSPVEERADQVRALEALGAEVLALTADITDEARMREVVDEACRRFGTVHGVFHTAGVAPGGLVQLKTEEAAARVMAPKLEGTRALAAALDGIPLDFFVLCSSRSAIFAPPGGVDYAAANAYLDAYAHAARAKGIGRTVSINWCGWEEVGMLAEAVGRLRETERPEESGAGEEVGNPLLGRLYRDPSGRAVFRSQLSVRGHWIANEHRIAGNPVVPGTTYLEMGRAAMAALGFGRVEIRDVFFLAPMRLREDEVRDVRLVLQPSGDEFDFHVESRSGQAPWERNMLGKAAPLADAPPPRQDLAAIAARCTAGEILMSDQDEQTEDLGARWQIVKRVQVGQREVLAALELPEAFAGDLETYLLHPSLLDRAAAIGEGFLAEGSARLPFSYQSLKLYAPLPRKIYSHARRADTDQARGETLLFDVTLLDEEGNVLVEVGSYCKKRVNDPTSRLRHDGPTRAASAAMEDGLAAADDAEPPRRTAISPAEGVEAFRRVLAYGGAPQIVVSPNDLLAAVRAAEAFRPSQVVDGGELDATAPVGPQQERPSLSTAYAPPETDVQHRLARLWQEVLGFERIGIHDNFFELGGDSLLAVQVIARARRAGLEIAPNQLFEHQTIAELAARLGPAAPEGGTSLPLVRSHRDGAVPLSFSQQRLWFLQQLDPESPVLNLNAAIRLRGSLRAPALEAAWNEVRRRHDLLRAVFSQVSGEPVQSFEPFRPVPLPQVDLGGLPRAERERELLRAAEATAQLPFDLARGPLLRSVLLRLDVGEHVVVYSLHHIVGDGWSLGVLGRELGELYEAFAGGRPSPLPELPVQYADFIDWQRRWLTEERLEAQLGYWRRQLGGTLPVLRLPLQRRRPPAPGFRGAARPIVLPRETVDALEGIARGEGATLFMTLLAGYKAVLHLYSGQEDVLVGTNVANRSRAELEPLIGFFVNTLALRTDLSGAPGLRELVRRVRDVAVAGYAHQDVPFEKVIQDLQPQRYQSYAPLLQTMFVFRSFPVPERSQPGFEISSYPLPERQAHFDLSLVMTERGEGFLLYDTDLFASATIERLAVHYQALLSAAAAEPDRPVTALPLVSESEARQLAVPAVPEPFEPIHEMFRRVAQRCGDRPAVRWGGRSVTYGQLDDRSNELARALREAGAKPGSLVAILAARTVDVIAAILGTLKAGCPFVPLDLRFAAATLPAILEVAEPRWWMVAESLAPTLDEQWPQGEGEAHSAPRFLPLNEGWTERGTGGPERPEPVASPWDPDGLAYVYFTSGSTGQPKGIAGRMRGIDHFLRWEAAAFGASEGMRVSQLTSPAFDAFLRDAFMPLTTGGTVCAPASLEIVLDGARLAGWIDGEGIELLHCTPSLFRSILAQDLQPDRFPALRHVLLAGEPLLPSDVARWYGVFGDRIGLVNLYGPSETTMVKLFHRVRAADQVAPAIPIGRPIGGAEALLVDEWGRSCPPGVVGEIYIRTPYRSLGYLNRPDLTRQAFVPNPLGDSADDLVYRTGDLGRLREDGSLEFLGRRDQQVKVRGVRVELAPIEERLRSHDAVADAAVAARTDIQGNSFLCAYVVLRRDAGMETLAEHLRATLPEAMVPSAFVVLESLPRTLSGKVDRRSLPDPGRAAGRVGREHVPPRTPAEEILCGLYSEVLAIPRVGVRDHFFELGGHSLLATTLLARVRSAFNVELSLRQILQTPSVEELAMAVTRLQLEREDTDEMASLLDEIEGLSPEELDVAVRAQPEVSANQDERGL